MVTVIDYGVGNLFSLASSLRAIGEEAVVTGDADKVRSAGRLILPGVGAFGDAAEKLRCGGLYEAVLDAAGRGVPLLGICLGMQLLFDESFEYGRHRGLGLIPGAVRAMEPADKSLKIPHMGWNALHITQPCPILKNTREGEHMYFVHSYYADTAPENIFATAEYGMEVPAVVGRGSVFGAQFHPEKSGERGLAILRAFCAMEGRA